MPLIQTNFEHQARSHGRLRGFMQSSKHRGNLVRIQNLHQYKHSLSLNVLFKKCRHNRKLLLIQVCPSETAEFPNWHSPRTEDWPLEVRVSLWGSKLNAKIEDSRHQIAQRNLLNSFALRDSGILHIQYKGRIKTSSFVSTQN